MDDDDWATTALFSPSKARLAQAQAKDWSFVDSWLSRKYASSRTPTFERNDDTLQALLVLMSLNEAADERRAVVERVERAAMQYYDKQKSEAGVALLHTISGSLDQPGHQAIETLAQVSLLLHTTAKNGIRELALATTGLQLQVFETQQAEASASGQLRALMLEHEELQRHLPFLLGDSLKASADLVEETARRQKGVKHLRAKIGEYDERLAAAKPSQSLLSLLEETKQLLGNIETQKSQLEIVHDEITTLQSFPRQQAAAKAMLDEAAARLQVLQRDKDRSLQKQAHG